MPWAPGGVEHARPIVVGAENERVIIRSAGRASPRGQVGNETGNDIGRVPNRVAWWTITMIVTWLVEGPPSDSLPRKNPREALGRMRRIGFRQRPIRTF